VLCCHNPALYPSRPSLVELPTCPLEIHRAHLSPILPVIRVVNQSKPAGYLSGDLSPSPLEIYIVISLQAHLMSHFVLVLVCL
jgi:hypothetical protein